MNSLIARQHQKQFFFASLLIIVLAYLFWTGSRYPALDEKAMMSGALQLEDNLSFEALVPITPDMGLIERIGWSTLNWLNTNKKGMTFGILFAAAFLTAAAYLQQRSFRGGFANSLLGMAIGTPLGVCVNCAAPIAQGMYSSGLRAETTLAAMIASPTLNIVVLTMLFSLLPFYMVATKIALSLAVILLMVPLICRFLPQRQIAAADAVGSRTVAPAIPDAPATRVHLALWEVTRNYLRNLWYIIRLTLPLMLLAGFLGALVATLLPQELILGLPFSIWVLIAIALVGVFLPVPIAFDVVVTGALLGLGLSHGYVMALLFTLGTFSVYSFLIVAQSVGPRAAWMLAGTVAGFGILAGAGAEAWHRYQTDRALELLLEEPQVRAPAPLWGAAWADENTGAVELRSTPLNPPSPAADTGFIRREAAQIGVDKPVEFSFRDMWPPFWEGRSLSSGDIDRDGDLDLVVASTEVGLYLYAGDGVGGFVRMGDAGPFADRHVFNAALADMDSDGWPDLVIATYQEGLWLWRNVEGRFGPDAPQQLANRADAPLAMALSFVDADGSGLLDIAVGNWAAGWYRRVPGEEARNRVLWNPSDGGGTFTDLPGIPGETLSILFSDVNGDAQADLLVGNDFEVPDYIYLGDGAGGFAMITPDQGVIPQTTTTTMAIKSGDLTGNGLPELYFAQIAGRSSGISSTLKMQDLDLYCDGIENAAAKEVCTRNMQIKTWYRSGNSFDPAYAGKCPTLGSRDAAECRAMLVKDLAIQKRDATICQLIPVDQRVPRAYCDLHFLPPRETTETEVSLAHPQILRSNVLLEPQANGTYTDSAEDRGLDVGGWSWDTKLRDFDLDGDLDVYIVNGTWVPNEVSPSNLYFENDGTGQFTERSGPAGLEDYLMTAAATAFDADGDGDMDMLTHPVNGPLVFFENTSSAPRLLVTLEDSRGNRDGLGAQVTLIDDSGHRQLRELQSGGGFMSFDAPQLSFGLAPGRSPDALEVRWPDGTTSRVEGGVSMGHHLHLRRL